MPKKLLFCVFRVFHFFVFLFLFVFISYCFHFFLFLVIIVFISSCFHFSQFLVLFVFVPSDVSSLLRCYHECYGFEKAFFTLRRFLSYTPSCVYQGFPGTGSSALKVAGLPTEVQNTDPSHLFESHSVWQLCDKQGTLFKLFIICL